MILPIPPDSAPAPTPWRCPHCGYDARGRAIGDPCAECGVPLGEASARPAWLDAPRIRRMRRAAIAGASLGLVPVVLLLASTIAARVVSSESMAWFFLALLAATMIGLLGQSIAAARVAVAGLGANRIRWIRVGAWARPCVVLSLLGTIFILDRLEQRFEGTPGTVVEALYIVLYFTLPALVVGGELLLGAMFAGIRREARVAAPVWHVALSTLRTVLVVVSYPVALFPFLGWVAGPLLWVVLSGVMFVLLARDLAVAAARADG